MTHEPVAILVPVLRRPHRVGPLVESILGVTQQPFTIVFICDAGDWREVAAVQSIGFATLLEFSGNYAQKINEAVRRTDTPLVFLAADDLDFHPCWLERCLNQLAGEVGVVGTNDLCNPRTATGELSTHTLVARWYIERHGTIDEPGKALHEGYLHEWTDQELVETAQSRGAYAHAADAIVEHLHPMHPDPERRPPVDALYAQQRRRMRHGRRLFLQRERLWRP